VGQELECSHLIGLGKVMHNSVRRAELREQPSNTQLLSQLGSATDPLPECGLRVTHGVSVDWIQDAHQTSVGVGL
jgi:hypothetical protein